MTVDSTYIVGGQQFYQGSPLGTRPGDPDRTAKPDKSGLTPNKTGSDSDKKPGRGTGMTAFEEAQIAMMEAQNRAQRESIAATITAVFNNYGLASLAGKIIEFAQKGYSGDAIAILLRETPEYKARFPAMATLAQKGRAINEAEYVAYERNAAQIEQQYGLPAGMVSGNVTRLLEGDVSAAELADRARYAAAGSVLAPQEFKDEFTRLFGVRANEALVAHYLDPDVAAPLLEKQYAMAVIGSEALKQGLTPMEAATLEELQQRGVTQAQAQQGFGEVAGQQALTAGRGDTASQGDLVGAAFGTDANAAAAVERAVKARRGAFDGGGGFGQDRRGNMGGLGVSST